MPERTPDINCTAASTLPRSAYCVRGLVEPGDRRGRTIGFPTANVAVDNLYALEGVWAGWVDLRGERLPAAISVGNRPTFYGHEGCHLLEAHLLDYNDDCYDELVTVWLCRRLRGQVRFGSVEELVAQLNRDIEDTRQWSRGVTRTFTPPSELVAAALGHPVPVRAA